MTQSTSTSKKPSHHAFQVRESANGKGFWTRIGVAWTNRDGGLSLQLEAIPLDGRIILQIPKQEEASESTESQAS